MALSIPTIPLIDFEAQAHAKERVEALKGANQPLGQLESVMVRLAGVKGIEEMGRWGDGELGSGFARKAILAVAGDYAHQGGSVGQTLAALETLETSDQAPLKRWSKTHDFFFSISDLGLKTPPAELPKNIMPFRVAQVQDMAVQAALTLPEVQDAIWVGMNLASQEIANGMDLAIPVNIGVGGKLSAAAVCSVLTHTPLDELLEDAYAGGLSKGAARELIEKAINLNEPDPQDPLDVLRCVGGAELCGLVGIMLVAAAGKVPIIIDSFVAGSAALTASYLSPAIRSYLFGGAYASDPGLAFVLKKFGLRPAVSLGFDSQYGEGGILAASLLEAALALL